MNVWTWEYNAFRLGGNPEQPIAAEVDTEPLALQPLGKGYFGYVFSNPVQKLFHVIESSSGAIVATGLTRDAVLTSVMDDVAAGDLTMMAAQVEESKRIRSAAPTVPPEKFWAMFKLRPSKVVADLPTPL